MMSTTTPGQNREPRGSGGVVCLYLLGMMLMFAHLGNTHSRRPPPFALPRLMFMGAVAVLVRWGGLSSSTKQTSSNFFEVYLVAAVCSLVLAYVWYVVEVMVYAIIIFILTAVEPLTGVALACEDCTTAANIQLPVVTLIAALTFVRVFSWTSHCGRRDLGLRFWPRVRVVFVNPRSHTPEHPVEAALSAPGGGHRKPVIRLTA